MNDYILMHKNKEVAQVKLSDRGIKVTGVLKSDFMPIGMSNNQDKTIDEQMNVWNGNRCIPLGRPNYQSFMKEMNIEQASDWIAKSYMCALTDCYWFKPADSNVTWKDVNFRDNGFSSNLYKHLFYGQNNEAINTLNSPDITTDGAEPKMWVERNSDFYLLKHYSSAMPNTVCNEFLISKIFSKLDIDCVDYNLIEIDGKICCESKCFITSNNEEFITAEDLMKHYGFTMRDVGKLMCNLGFEKEFNKMVLGDYLSGNVDRHSRNFGILIDSDTRNIKQFAPLFDHGESYIYANMDNMMYIVGETTFGKAIENVDVDVLKLIDNVDEKDITEILDQIPYISFEDKCEIFDEFFRRADHIHDIIREKELEYEQDLEI